MPYPKSWPPRPPTGRRTLRFFAAGTTTGSYADNAHMFAEQEGASPYNPTPVVAHGSRDVVSIDSPMGGGVHKGDPEAHIWCQNITITNDGAADLYFTFDGVRVHGIVKPGESRRYRNRFESGIAFRSGTPATGSITVVAGVALVDGETVTIGDGSVTATFEFDLAGNGVGPGNTAVLVAAGDTAEQVRDKLLAAIQGSSLNIIASASGTNTISLENLNAGTAGNVLITETVADAGFIVSGMAGGTDASTDYRVEAY